ncbi:nucleoside 2-deoxyribosyltransferase domain-containing protein [Candidatus Saccharibacteria bacterium]|nr:nucleoside 2-deoxyribosyltransferase domain-containing protein [Candidatus Saccharibacteria bacterium]
MVEHRPPDLEQIPENEPAIFLAGPIQGAPDWQDEAYRLITRDYKSSDILHVFNPRVHGELSHGYQKQVHWEKRHLERARSFGVIAFWFAAKNDMLPYEKNRAYAQTSRVELGRAFGWKDFDATTQIVLGIEPTYRGGNATYFESMAAEYDMPVYQTLGSLCLAAIEQVPTSP